MSKFLCDNKFCPKHCEIEKVDEKWIFSAGFKMSVHKHDLKFFDSERERNLCQICREAKKMGEVS